MLGRSAMLRERNSQTQADAGAVTSSLPHPMASWSTSHLLLTLVHSQVALSSRQLG